MNEIINIKSEHSLWLSYKSIMNIRIILVLIFLEWTNSSTLFSMPSKSRCSQPSVVGYKFITVISKRIKQFVKVNETTNVCCI